MAGMLAFTSCCCVQREPGQEQVFPGSRTPEVPVAEIAFQPDSEKRTLQVPPDFSIRSIDSTISSGSAYVSLNEEQKAREMNKLQHMIRDFVMEFLQGVYLDAVLEDGSSVPCKCIMDSKLTVLLLQVHQTTRTIDLTKIHEICSGRDLRGLRVTTPLDDLCVTLVMTD